jgi:gluconokinase
MMMTSTVEYSSTQETKEKQPVKMVIMGVSGCGKTSVGLALSERLSIPFYDGDEFHPAENVEKMRSGQPLNDEDRQGWLETLSQLINDNQNVLVACSALKPSYRDILAHNNPELVFVYLKGDFELIWSRLQKRENHYFHGQDMLKSQFAALFEPDVKEAVHVDISQPIDGIVDQIVHALG